MGMDNRTLLQKADMALSDLTASSGLLQPAQAAKFMRLLIKESKLLPQMTVVPMKSHTHLIDKIGIEGRVLRPGREAVALTQAERVKPTTSQVELKTELFKAECRLSNEVLEDSIERGELRQTIMTLLAEHIGKDLEELVICGDTTSTDPFLATMDGFLKQAQSHVVDHGEDVISRPLFKNMLKSLPQEYLRSKAKYKYFTSVGAEIDYVDSFADRETALGDAATRERVSAAYHSIPVEAVPMFPEDLGEDQNCTSALFMDPKNANFGIWRKIRLETDKDISAGVLMIVATLRVGCLFEHEDAVVKGINIRVAA